MAIIVVGDDGSETSANAVREAADLAEAFGATLHVVSAYRRRDAKTVEVEGGSWVIGGIARAEEIGADTASRFRDRVEVTTAALEGDPAAALVAEAERLNATMIVVGSVRTQGVARILGSVATGVLRDAPCSVHIAHTSA